MKIILMVLMKNILDPKMIHPHIHSKDVNFA